MPSMMSNRPSTGTTSDKAQRGFTFSPQTPSEFANIILGQAHISDLKALKQVFLGDPGVVMEMRRSNDKSSFDFVDASRAREPWARNGWFVMERGPGFLADEPPRMTVFRTFEGAAAEFVVRLKQNQEGSLTVGKVPAGPLAEATRFTFEAENRTMVMAPVATPLTGLLL
jgi:hypothetical protein